MNKIMGVKMTKYHICFLIILFLMACVPEDSEPQYNDANAFSFQATILETDNSFMVKPLEGQNELLSADKIVISLTDTIFLNEDGNEIDIEKFEVGQKVKIYYNGMIAESYPAQIHHCGKIQMMQ